MTLSTGSDGPRLTVAYADPPYIGQSSRHYADHADYAGEVDHGDLLDKLIADYPDGWALSLHMPSLGALLAMCYTRGHSLMNGDIRVGAWCKTFGAFKKNVRVAYVWEPVIYKPPRRLEGAVPTRDFGLDAADGENESPVLFESITMKRGLSGAKPERFSFWLFNIMGLRPCDDLHDLFPGSHAVGDAWTQWKALGGPNLKQAMRVTNELQDAA
jgi:hypothetical protein